MDVDIFPPRTGQTSPIAIISAWDRVLLAAALFPPHSIAPLQFPATPFDPTPTAKKMNMWRLLDIAVALTAATLLLSPGPVFAQSGNTKSAEQQRPQARQPVDPAKERQRILAEYAEAAKVLNGPAGNPECVWVGRRAISLLWRDDLNTAFRQLALYDRFGCPGAHIKASFRCLVKLGDIDPKQPESLHGRVHSCWVDPAQRASAPPGAVPTTPSKR